MKRTVSNVTVAIMSLGLVATTSAPAHAVTINTKPDVAPYNWTMLCPIANVNLKPTLTIQAQLIDETGANVTDFARNNWLAEPGGTLASIDVESRRCSVPHVCYCRITVSGGRRSDVRWNLLSYDPSVPQ